MNKNIHIIGGTGRIGTFIANFFKEKGFPVTVSGRILNNVEIKKADIIYVSVPISASFNTIKRAGNIAKRSSEIIDLSSVMSPAQKAFSQIKQNGYSMHLLFGPTVSSFASQTIVISKNAQKDSFPIPLFEKEGSLIISMDAKEHDKTMALVQNLTHFVNLSFAKTISHRQYKDTISPSFLAQLSAVNRVLSQDAKLLSELQKENSYGTTLIHEFLENSKMLLTHIKNGAALKEVKNLQKNFRGKRIVTKKPKNKSTQLSVNKRVGFLGPEGTYSHAAALELRPKKLTPFETIPDVFEAVVNKSVDIGIVPAQNTREGAIRETFDELASLPVKTIGAVYLPIHHVLASLESDKKKITHIYSHPQALGQCRNFIKQTLSSVKLIPTQSTLSEVSLHKSEKGAAFILGKEAAEKHGLSILHENIEDDENNTTRFFIIEHKNSKEENVLPKTLLFLSIYNRVGILKDILSVFANENINLCNIESRPSKDKSWDYNFFIEVEIHSQDEKLSEAINILRQYCPHIKILGGVN